MDTRAGADALAAPDVKRLREAGFLLCSGTTCEMPAVIRRQWYARSRADRTEAEISADHARICDHIRAASIEEEIEAHHHAVQSGDLERAKQTAKYYGADLRSLAYQLGRRAALQNDQAMFLRAAEVYRTVVREFDAQDAYSWEYYALNLARAHAADAEGIGDEVEAAYQRAHALAPHNPLFHGRLVGFQITRSLYDRNAVERSLTRYRMAQGSSAVSYFGQAVINGLRLAGNAAEASALARAWKIVPRERRPAVEHARKPRRFGVAAGSVTMAPDFDAPLEDFENYE